MSTETIAGTMGMGQIVEEHPKDWSIRKLQLRPTDSDTPKSFSTPHGRHLAKPSSAEKTGEFCRLFLDMDEACPSIIPNTRIHTLRQTPHLPPEDLPRRLPPRYRGMHQTPDDTYTYNRAAPSQCSVALPRNEPDTPESDDKGNL